MLANTKVKKLPELNKSHRTNLGSQMPDSTGESTRQSIIIIEKDKLQIIVEEIARQIVQTTIAEIRAERLILHKVLTIKQLAEFLQVSTQSILNWSRREKDENPLPVRYAGANPRFYKSEIDEWMLRETELKQFGKKNITRNKF